MPTHRRGFRFHHDARKLAAVASGFGECRRQRGPFLAPGRSDYGKHFRCRPSRAGHLIGAGTERAHRWVIDGTGKDGGRATITYTLTRDTAGANFERELVYAMPNQLLAVLDWLISRSRMKAAPLKRYNG